MGAELREVGGAAHALAREATVLGRDPHSDIVLRGDVVSRRHAAVFRAGAAFDVEDLGSANGTFLNGHKLTRRVRLRSGDRLELGNHTFVFHDDPTASIAEPPRRDEAPPSIVASLDMEAGRRLAVAAEAKLRAVLEIGRALGATLDLDVMLPKVVESFFVLFPQAESVAVLLLDPARGEMTPKALKRRGAATDGDPGYSRSIVQYAAASGRAVLSDDAARDQRFAMGTSVHRLSLTSAMCVPMVADGGEGLGAVYVATQDGRRPFTEEDLDVLVSAASQCGRAVELWRWHQERRDLEAATRIQKSFLPMERPRVDGLRFFDHYAAARYVGGDYYDYIPLPGDRWAVTIGDVAGKGVSAALLMARLSAAARFCLASAASPAEGVRRINGQMAQAIREDRFVTFVAAVLDLKTWTATLVNAGHLPPLLRRSGGQKVEVLAVESAGLPLGVFDRGYQEENVTLEPGDALVLVTDGVTEARNPAGELYGLDRLRAAVAGARDDVEALGRAVLADVQAFAAGRPAGDDLTLVVVGRPVAVLAV